MKKLTLMKHPRALLFFVLFLTCVASAHAQNDSVTVGPTQNKLVTPVEVWSWNGTAWVRGGGGAGGSGGVVTFANPATTPFRNTALSSTPVVVKATAGSVYGWNVTNLNASPVYLKVYDSAAPTVGTTTPIKVYVAPANGVFFLSLNGFPQVSCTTAITIAAVTGYLDNSTAAPTTGLFVQADVSTP